MVSLHLGTGIALIAWQSFTFKLRFMEIEPVPAAAQSYPHTARARLFELMRQQNRREVRALLCRNRQPLIQTTPWPFSRPPNALSRRLRPTKGSGLVLSP
ncbi:hypothetical protein RAZWK3B_15148 [Roseobacter sp. AzwK-3b]|nr:hypothetical protein RAZWK3B_15148 [Roseobacter sp. AzwK-3b]